ncbi:ATP-binding protein [Chloroflexi bacterium TSY]|nr:ATP-binding protein [Chloroflexi bacterium TSY]
MAKRIPYGVADYRRIREENCYYVDKTQHIPLIEAAPYYLFFIRPRRTGKSLWLSLLQHYYDINLKDEFDALFGGTYIGEHPTADRHSYLTIFFNFSMVNPDIQYVQQSFEENGHAVIRDFLVRYKRFFDPEVEREILTLSTVDAQLREIFFHAYRQKLKIYLFIDEYDNFANTILSTEGEEAYHNLTHGGDFFRFFFNLLKGATGGQIAGLTRMFITGVSPITMDDVTSGFNIGTNISLNPNFNELVGFNEVEVIEIMRHYRDVGGLPIELELHLELMKNWYNNYKFAKNVDRSVFNPDMVLYFLEHVRSTHRLPDDLIDQNVRIDYGKLQHLVTVDPQLNGNFSQLQEIIETGQTISNVVLSFPLKRLLARENFISLLYYFGLLNFAGEQEGEPLLRIPNFTVKYLLYSHIRDGFQDVNVFRLDLWHLSKLIRGMAYRGEWEAVFDFLKNEIQQQASVRDYLDGEKMIQGFLLAYLNITHFFLTWSEREMGGGFVDLYLEPFLARYTDMKFGYLIELKYISSSQYTEQKLETEISNAKKQIQLYAQDERIQKVSEQVAIKNLILVYRGWELIHQEEWKDW